MVLRPKIKNVSNPAYTCALVSDTVKQGAGKELLRKGGKK